MKKLFYSFLILSSCLNTVAQDVSFEKLTAGTLVNQLSDSRSVNFVDVNKDGWEDVFISNGINPGTKNLFYLNNGNGEFTAVTSGDIVSHAAPFDGATFADANNDGNLDAFVVTWYGYNNFFYTGNGDGTFSHVSGAAMSSASNYSETAAWGDYDGDGDLDLYVTNSTDFSGNPLKNEFFRNTGNGVFSKINSGIQSSDVHASRSVNWVDVDNDCDLDLFVSNELNQPDDLYINNGNSSFSISPNPPSQSSRSTMSSSWGDVDNDGDLDLFVSNAGYFSPQKNQLFINNNDGTFTESTAGALPNDNSCSYGSNFGDYDNDGDLDLVVTNGYCNGNILNFLYKNDGTGYFIRDYNSIQDLSTPCSYGAAWGDINNDGFLDLGIATCKNTTGSPLSNNIFYKNSGNENNWIKVRPIGVTNNRSGIGAKVWLTATINGESVTQLREISSQSGYCGQNSLYAHFGLGDANMIDEIRVQFGCNSEVVWTGVAANQLIEIAEGGPNASNDMLRTSMEVIISPNPVSDSFVVEFINNGFDKVIKCAITDAIGKNVWEGKGNIGSTLTLDAGALHLNRGVYYFIAESDDDIIRKSFVVQ